MNQVRSDGRTLVFSGVLGIGNLAQIDSRVRELLEAGPAGDWIADLRELEHLDTAGAVFLHRLPSAIADRQIQLQNLPEHLQPFFDFANPGQRETPRPTPDQPVLESLGERIANFNTQALDFLYLMSDLTYFAIHSILHRGGIRRDSFVDQAYAIGAQALPIIGLIIFLIGAVSALQSAVQLRQFGADIFVADLLAIGITRELGPLMTAIMVSGRSGSAIAAEIATMKFTEELDALHTMALEPLRFVAVPKLWAMVICMPLLTIMADFIGILGGTFVGVTSMGIAPTAFLNQVVSSLFLKDILTGLTKSVFFAWIITIIAVYRGLNFSGGAVGVGRAITSSVVSSLVGIIVLDLIFNLLFY
ncbi:MAG: phospholipid/cholesterol/gamma-HCH transport system permease protein [Candidatus Latescibacterota bacterium]|jgi:phospholipid/cholesterol/gamma-HCH transport system permease protein